MLIEVNDGGTGAGCEMCLGLIVDTSELVIRHCCVAYISDSGRCLSAFIIFYYYFV